METVHFTLDNVQCTVYTEWVFNMETVHCKLCKTVTLTIGIGMNIGIEYHIDEDNDKGSKVALISTLALDLPL